MGLEHRPYIGNWRLNNKKLVQYTPDGLVFVNGDTSLPGCSTCNGKIDIQQFITQISVDAGTDPTGASAQISMTVPLHGRDQFHRNSQFLLRPGLEVHIYLRGYFPIKGQYRNLSPDETGGTDVRNLPAYPYYHAFHGVVTQVDHSYSGGFQDITINCVGMPHFWQFHNVSTNASVFGTRPTNSKLKTSLVGHNFTGMSPFSIIYTLFHDTAGAAGGVAFALSSKTNVAAKSSVLDSSLYSLNIRYWEERFKQRMINLRMHGSSGQLFSTAQAAFLSRLKTGGVRRLLDAPFTAKTNANNSKKFDLLSAARTINLLREVEDPATGQKTIQGLDVVEAERSADPSSAKKESRGGYEVNVAAMQAIVSDIGQWGQVNLFESTYESKLDMVNKVLEVTGWEFYQDVDGDFVFKPPLYNLDTRGSRAYVLKDIDIMSISISEKEPEATYITMNGSQFKNLKGTGLEGEWGVRGQYIDYRLVAQFGWKPSSFETSYFSNPRSMFFAAVNRLDVLNAGMNSATCSIPMRPELRPGYPVYIEYLDTFYYLPSFNHAMVFGGQCTTNLTLTAKRAPFLAPGNPRSSGVDAIDLSNTKLPKRPLEIAGEDGLPRTKGFPNVVLALDPNAVNPLFFQAGLDLDRIDNPQVLRNVLRVCDQYGLVSFETDENGVERIVFNIDNTLRQEISTGENLSPERSGLSSAGSVRGVYTFDELVSVSRTFASLSSAPSQKIESNGELIAQKTKKIGQKQNEINSLISEDQNTSKGDQGIPRKIEALDVEIDALRLEIAELRAGIASEQKALEQAFLYNPDVQLLVTLLKELPNYTSGSEDFSAPSQTSNLLDLLSDKKAIFSNGQLPGFYRYFSSAHPNPRDQAPKKLDTTLGSGGGEGSGFDTLTTQVAVGEDPDGNPIYEERPVTRTVPAFLRDPKKPFIDGSGFPETELGTQTVDVGLRVLRSRGSQVQSTDQILTIAFQKHDFESLAGQTVYEDGEFFDGLDSAGRSRVKSRFPDPASIDPLSTIATVYAGVWDAFLTVDGENYGLPFPSDLSYKNETFNTYQNTISDFKNVAFPDDSDTLTSAATLNSIISELLISNIAGLLRNGWVSVDSIDPEKEPARRKEEVKRFSKILKVLSGGKGKFKLGKRKKVSRKRKDAAYSPVFPVSDSGGYEVIGTYRYGRGLQINPDASMEQIALSDPLQFADRQAVEDYLDALQGRVPRSLGLVTENGERTGGRPPEEILTAAMRQLAESISTNPGAPPELIEQTRVEASQNSVSLRNWMARNNEGVLRLPVNNAAFSLADLHSNVVASACVCKTADASISLDAFSNNFVQVIANPDLDQVSQFVSDRIFEKGLQWKRVRQGLRGQTLSRESKLLDATRDIASSVQNFGNFQQASLESLSQSTSEVEASLDALEEAATGFEATANAIGSTFSQASQAFLATLGVTSTTEAEELAVLTSADPNAGSVTPSTVELIRTGQLRTNAARRKIAEDSNE